MELYSTNDKNNIVNLKEATLKSLPRDKGLYLPLIIPTLEKYFIKNLSKYSFQEIAYRVSNKLIGLEVDDNSLIDICNKAINFPAPVKQLDNKLHTLELFHGPSLAFKDFGARFMAELMSHFIRNENNKLTILVATSGDTGGAVAAGFHKVDNIEVIILYPSGKVSPLQEKQLTTWGDNIHAIEWDGTFDDCQATVKKAFLDPELSQYDLSSANSINIARLIPQSFYYFEAVKQIGVDKKISFSVPSGNIGNISAGSMARNMGLPIDQFIAAHNSNNTVTEYYKNGDYIPKKSVSTISNAMDVGNPSNFPRYEILNGSTWNNVKKDTLSFSYNDEITKVSMKEIHKKYNYISEPHAAVAYTALKEYSVHKDNELVFLGTAHPAKFKETVEKVLNIELEIPESLVKVSKLKKEATKLSDYNSFVEWMKSRN